MKSHKTFRIIGFAILGVIIALVLGLVLGLVVMALWNWLMPALFGLPVIGYWQAVGLYLLCHILFKGHSGHDHDAHHKTLHRKPGHKDVGELKKNLRDWLHDEECGSVEPKAKEPDPAS